MVASLYLFCSKWNYAIMLCNMNERVQIKNKAILLRKSGLSYSEIFKEIKVPKGTLSSWLRMIVLTNYQKTLLDTRLQLRKKQGRFSASIALKARRVYREQVAFGEAERRFKNLMQDSFFVCGLTLYLAHGSKSGNFQFTHSDPDIIMLFKKWIEKYLKSVKLIKYRLIIYESYRNSDYEAFWSRILGISRKKLSKTIYRKSSYFHKKSPDYKGSMAITISDIALLRKVLAWQNLLIKYYKGTESLQ